MRRIGIMLISMVGQDIYASETKEEAKEKKLVEHYSSHDRREKRTKSRVRNNIAMLKALNRGEDTFASNPRALIHYRLEDALGKGELPLESPQLTAEIHGLKKLHSYVSGMQLKKTQGRPRFSHSSSGSFTGAKIAPMELESAPGHEEDDEEEEEVSNTAKPAPPESCLSCCVIL